MKTKKVEKVITTLKDRIGHPLRGTLHKSQHESTTLFEIQASSNNDGGARNHSKMSRNKVRPVEAKFSIEDNFYRESLLSEDFKLQYCFWNRRYRKKVEQNEVIPGNLQKYASTSRSLLQCKTLPAHFSNNMMVYCLLNSI